MTTDRIVYKHAIHAVAATVVPFGAEDTVLAVATQAGKVCVWVEHLLPLANRAVVFRGVPTGGSPRPGDVYVGTAHDVEGAGFVIHIYREGAAS